MWRSREGDAASVHVGLSKVGVASVPVTHRQVGVVSVLVSRTKGGVVSVLVNYNKEGVASVLVIHSTIGRGFCKMWIFCLLDPAKEAWPVQYA